MAKAEAICTCKTCGKQFTMYAIKRNRRDAESWEKWAAETYIECDECKEARRKMENEAAAEASKTAGYTDLEGSPKQVAWATTIRQEAVEAFRYSISCQQTMIDRYAETDPKTADEGRQFLAKAEDFIDWLLSDDSHRKASWWIDQRDNFSGNRSPENHRKESLERAIRHFRREFQEHMDALEDARTAADVAEEIVAEPEEKKHPAYVTVTVQDNTISAGYMKDDDFRKLMKDLRYRWDPDKHVWARAISRQFGGVRDRAAELGNRLLNAGFAVSIQDGDIRKAAIEGNYEPERLRWIALYGSGDYEGWLAIMLPYGEDMYDKAKALPGSRYYKPNVAVPVSEWKEVEDFARCYDYKLTQPAMDAIEQYRRSSAVVNPAPSREMEYNEQAPGTILESSRDILDDLKEED